MELNLPIPDELGIADVAGPLLALGIAVACWVVAQVTPLLINGVVRSLVPAPLQESYDAAIAPRSSLVRFVAVATVADVILVILGRRRLEVLEWVVAAGLTAAIVALLWRWFNRFFEGYVFAKAAQQGRRVNSELLLAVQYVGNGAIITLLVLTFAQTHGVNAIGLLAGLGVGGLAVAFAAQKTLEQVLGGIVLYLDRPFSVDDYIGLDDGTFGRVEAIGLRSTKVRTSGKGTLVVVPNSALTEASIENYSGAKKVLALLSLKVPLPVTDAERALIRQVIFESTGDIFGLDPRNTDIAFRQVDAPNGAAPFMEVQVTLFILGSGEVSMDFRRQLIDIARENLTQRLLEYGLEFDAIASPIYVDAPLTV